MRDIVVRSLTSQDMKNRDCCVTEVVRQGDYFTTVMRRCTYNVESKFTIPSLRDVASWAQNLDPSPPRQVYVTKDMDPETGDERVTYKVLGHFYVVINQDVFCIGYRHVLSMAVGANEMLCEG
jgi:hypothetical protein